MKKFPNMKQFLLIAIPAMLISCTSNPNVTSSYPKSPEQRRDERIGSLAGPDGLVLYSGNGPSNTFGIKQGKTESNLWQAALEVVSFMPLASVDSAAGVIITDWYNSKDTPDERFKLNVLIIKPNTVQIRVFKQVLKSGQWYDQPANPDLAKDFEAEINSKAKK